MLVDQPISPHPLSSVYLLLFPTVLTKSSNNDHAIEEGIEIGKANHITAVGKYRACLPNEVVEDAAVVMEAAMDA